MVLTEKQKKELNEAILDYLSTESETFQRTLAAFREESNISSISAGTSGLLEKKWTSVVRLQKRILDLENQIATLQKFPQGSRDISMTSGDLRIIPKGPPQHTLQGHRSTVLCLAVHPHYALLATGSEDALIKLWDYEAAQYERTLKGHSGPITGLAFDLGGNILCSSSADMSAKVWDMKSFTCTNTLRGHDHTLSGIVASPSGDKIFTCSRDSTLKCWDLSNGYCIKTYVGHTDWVKTISVSSDGELLASAGCDQNIIIWRSSTATQFQMLRGHEHVIECVRFGRRFHTVVEAAEVAASAAETRAPLESESTGEIASIGSLPSIGSEFNLVSASRDKTVRVWELRTGNCIRIFTAHENWVRGALFDPTGRFVVSCSDDKSIRVFDVKEDRCIRSIEEAHSHFVTSIAASSQRPIYFTGSVDKSIALWSC